MQNGVGNSSQKLLHIVGKEVEPDFEELFNRWYDTEHVPELLACPGFERARRYVKIEEDVEGSPQHIVLYDITSPAAFETAAYLKHLDRGKNGPTSLNQEVSRHATTSLNAKYSEVSYMTSALWPSEMRQENTGPRILSMVSLGIDPEYEEKFNYWYDTVHVPENLECPGTESARRYVMTSAKVNPLAKYLVFWDIRNVKDSVSGAKAALASRTFEEFSPLAKEIRLHRTRIINAKYVEILNVSKELA